MNTQESSISLGELNRYVRDSIKERLPEAYWMRAETSDVRRNQNGHCYLEFVEKDPLTNNLTAKARGIIWGSTFQMLSQYFKNETDRAFDSGLKVLVRVSVDFHELYGYTLTVVDIDPTYTIGEAARNREMIIRQLEQEGVLTLNKELALPELCNRIAVISSPTAAGYEDFVHQLNNNPYGLKFYPKLFPAIMQGERSEESVIHALELIFNNRHLFDAVAIIRGGGATSDLSSFDTYLLATNCAQFPLPIISGIGHERDVTVIDFVAHTRAKTPTAVAEIFINHLSSTYTELMNFENRLVIESRDTLQSEKVLLEAISREIYHRSNGFIRDEMAEIKQKTYNLRSSVRQIIQNNNHKLSGLHQFIQLVSPENILKRGYTLTLQNGKIVTSIKDLNEKEVIETLFKDGKVISEIKNMEI